MKKYERVLFELSTMNERLNAPQGAFAYSTWTRIASRARKGSTKPYVCSTKRGVGDSK